MVVNDPAADLDRRAQEWEHQLADHSLGAIAAFAASLAATEGDAWDDGHLDIATRAYEARRFLLADRVIHWAVPWLLAAGETEKSQFLLDLGDVMRVAPVLPGREGLILEGEDSYGPLQQRGSIWSGWVEGFEKDPPDELQDFWSDLGTRHAGADRRPR